MSISSVFWMNVVTVWRYDRRYQCNGWYQAWCKWRDLQFTNYPEIGPQVLSINQLDILYTYIHIDRKRCIIGAAASISVVLQLIIATPSSLNISLLNISPLNISLMLLSVWITLFTRSHWMTFLCTCIMKQHLWHCLTYLASTCL